MSAGAMNSDKLTGESQDDALSLLEVVRLVWARQGGLFILVKVKIGNKGADAPLPIRGPYLRQLQSILKPFFYHIGRSERWPLLSAQDGLYLVMTRRAKMSTLACDNSATIRFAFNTDT